MFLIIKGSNYFVLLFDFTQIKSSLYGMSKFTYAKFHPHSFSCTGGREHKFLKYLNNKVGCKVQDIKSDVR